MFYSCTHMATVGVKGLSSFIPSINTSPFLTVYWICSRLRRKMSTNWTLYDEWWKIQTQGLLMRVTNKIAVLVHKTQREAKAAYPSDWVQK